MWKDFSQCPLNTLDCFYDPQFLLFAFAAVERDHLQRVAYVVIHIGDYAQAALDILVALPLAQRQHLNQRCPHQTYHQIGKQNQIATRHPFAVEMHFHEIAA